MHRSIRQAGYLVTAAALVIGCGHQSKVETPAPQDQESPSSTIPSTPASMETVPEDVLDRTRLATLEERIYFGFDEHELSPAARQSLMKKGEILGAAPNLALRIDGHADERGSDEYNLALSNRRAAAAKRFLVNLGISEDRLETVGYGEERPLDPGETEAAWGHNRRDEFRVSTDRLARQ